MYNQLDTTTTIVAPATATGGAVVVVRLSGNNAIEIADKMFRGKHPLREAKGYTLHYGTIVDSENNTIDDVVVSIFRAPHSYTGDNPSWFGIYHLRGSTPRYRLRCHNGDTWRVHTSRLPCG